MGWCVDNRSVFTGHLAVVTCRILHVQIPGHCEAVGDSQTRDDSRRLGHHVRRYWRGNSGSADTERHPFSFFRLVVFELDQRTRSQVAQIDPGIRCVLRAHYRPIERIGLVREGR